LPVPGAHEGESYCINGNLLVHFDNFSNIKGDCSYSGNLDNEFVRVAVALAAGGLYGSVSAVLAHPALPLVSINDADRSVGCFKNASIISNFD